MIKRKALLTIMAAGLIVFGISNSGICAAINQKVAIVEVPAVVAKSAQVQALKKENEAETKKIEQWLKEVKEDVEKQKTQEDKEKLLKKYNAEFAKKKEAIAKDYAARLQAVDKSITETISTTAKAKGYSMVISKGVVVFGGDDITADVQKTVK